jgi:CheY-like chemotaxis protein
MAHIMVVEDEEDAVRLLRFTLEKEGHRVSFALNGAEALSKLGVDPERPAADLPDLIVLDVMMPVMDGYTVNSRLSRNPRTRNLPVVVLTAKGETRDLFEFQARGLTFISKPYNPKELRDVIGKILSKKK